MATVTDRQRSLEQLAREALDVQDACNLRGILLGWHRAACDLWDRLAAAAPGEDINGAFRKHPIMILWADKVLDLMRRPQALQSAQDYSAFGDAYEACNKLACRAASLDESNVEPIRWPALEAGPIKSSNS